MLVQSTLTAGQRQNPTNRTSAASAAHWPRFRGPDSNPVAENPSLPVSWSKTENVEWVADVPGTGWSSPVVWGNRVFMTAATSDTPMKQPSLGVDFSNEYLAELRKQGLSTQEANKKLYERDREMPDELVISLMLYCYDLETGKKLWEREMYTGHPAGGRHSKNSFASETPTTDGERVYVYLTDYGLFAFDFAGKPVWTTPLKSHASTRDWGTGASAALYKDRLFVLNDNEEASFVAAFETRTGKELWRTPRSVQPARKSGWSTPFVWENPRRTELITLGPGVAISYSLDGTELWRMNRMGGYAIQSPFAWHDLLFVTSGAGGEDNRPIVAVRAGASGDITLPAAETRNEHVVWYDRAAGGTYLPTPVIYKEALYVLSDKGIFSRRNPETGERLYQARVAPGPATFTASPWAYNGHVFALSEEGDTYVVEAGDEFRRVRTNSLDDFTMATPAIVGDRLLIRTQHRLYSIRNATAVYTPPNGREAPVSSRIRGLSAERAAHRCRPLLLATAAVACHLIVSAHELQERPAILHAADVYLSAQATSLTDLLQRGALGPEPISDLQRHGRAWVEAASVDQRAARRIAIAMLALELANAHLGDKWSDARVLVEWACELLREDKPTEAERLWHLASIDLAHGARDWTLLRKRLPEVSWEGAIVPPDGPKAYDHLEHAIARFPADAEVRFAGALTEAVQVAPAWRRTPPSRPLVSVRGGPDRDPAITALREFLADPHHGAEAHLWVGMLLMLDHQRPNDALGYFEVASRSHDAFVAYLAHYQAGRLLEQTGLASASEGHYRRALTVLPNTQSAALSLAALQFGRGNPEEAYRLASASVSDPAAVDPFQSYGFGSYRSFRHNLGRIREALTW